MDFFTIGPLSNAALHEAGRHMATVYRSGHVDHMGLAEKRETEERTGYRTGLVLTV
jgi:hypothetical protein